MAVRSTINRQSTTLNNQGPIQLMITFCTKSSQRLDPNPNPNPNHNPNPSSSPNPYPDPNPNPNPNPTPKQAARFSIYLSI